MAICKFKVLFYTKLSKGMRSLHIIKWMHIKGYTYWTYICTCVCMGFPGGAHWKNPTANAEGIRDMGSLPGSGRFLEEGLATHSSILAWRIPWTEEPGGLQSMGLQSWTWLKCLSTHACVCVYLITFIITSPGKPSLQSTVEDGHRWVCGVRGLWAKLLYLLINISVTLPQCYLLSQWINRSIH